MYFVCDFRASNSFNTIYWIISFLFYDIFKFSFFLLLFCNQVMSDSLWSHGLQHIRLPWPSLSPGVCANWCPLSQWCHPTISSSAAPFSFCLHSFPASGSFSVSQFLASGGQSIGVSASASVLPMNIQDWFPLGWTGCISLQSKGLWRVFSNYSAIKKDKVMPFAAIWVNLEIIIRSEISQKDKYHMISLICGI